MEELKECGLCLTGRLLEERRILITGAASKRGIGRAAAALAAAHGAKVAIADLDAEGAASVAAEIGEQAVGLGCDVTSPGSCAAAVETVNRAFGGIDVLVNNAGLTRGTSVEETSLEDFDLMFKVNVYGMFHMTQAVIPIMRRLGGGNIICLSSGAGQRGGGLYGKTPYAASKAAAAGFGKALARELAPDNIRVNVIAPSLIDTDASPDDSSERRRTYERDVPMQRSGRKWEVASVILFLSSDMSTYMTGATVDVNGGFHIH